MIRRDLKQLKVLHSRDPRDFEKEYNEAMLELAKFDPQGTYSINPENYSAVIEYTREVKIPEDIRDEFELQGVKYTCSMCPYFKLPEDKRIKKVVCSETGRPILSTADSDACVWLYKKIAIGEVKI